MSVLGDKVNNILREIASGKNGALERLHNATYNHLRIVAFNYLADPSDVEDVLNDTYFKVSRYIHSADVNKDGYNWMCKIVQNIAYDYNSQHEVFTPINKIESKSLFYEIDDILIEKDRVLQIIKTMHEETQKLIYFKFWEDLSYEEIARKMGMKKPTVYKRIMKILGIIRKDVNK